MIRYPRGTLRSIDHAIVTVAIDGVEQTVTAPVPVGATEPGDAVILATNELHVGIETLDVTMLLGRWPRDAEDPAGPRGLALTPVVAIPDPGLIDLARAGAIRAGGLPTVLVLPEQAPSLGLQYLIAIGEGVDVILIEGGTASGLVAARMLDGRPIAALPLDDLAALPAFLDGCHLDLHVSLPFLEGDRRSDLRRQLRPLALEEQHHVVEVDPRPAFDELGISIEGASLSSLAAAAAGVLAGRLAVGNRRWRTESGT
jgi:hypothetical protein